MIQTGDPQGDGTGGESIWGGEFEAPQRTTWGRGKRQKRSPGGGKVVPEEVGRQEVIVLEMTERWLRSLFLVA